MKYFWEDSFLMREQIMKKCKTSHDNLEAHDQKAD